MTRKAILFCILFIYGLDTSAQHFNLPKDDVPGITIWISSDTLVFGDHLELKFEINNLDGNFNAPALHDFKILRGPNVSHSLSIVNGVRTSTETYSYILAPMHSGISIIEQIVFTADKTELVIEEIKIIYLNKPEDEMISKKSQKGITLFYGLDQKPVLESKKKINQYKKRKV